MGPKTLARCGFVIAALGCSAGSERLDAGAADANLADADALPRPCVGGAPGVSVHLSFDPVEYTGWFPYEQVLSMSAPGGSAAYVVPLAIVNAEHTLGTANLGYPPGTVAGPAVVVFYHLGPGICDARGARYFTADPTRCLLVALPVGQVCMGDPDWSYDAGLP